MAARKGKVAALPWEIREQLNVRLRNGEQAGAILPWLNALPEVPAALAARGFGGPRKTLPRITEQNLSEWRRGGYVEWLDKAEEVEATRALSELAFRLANASGGSVTGAATTIAAGKMLARLESEDPEALYNYGRAIAKLSEAESERMRAQSDRRRLDVAEQRLSLATLKFRRETAALFLDWLDDRRAREIAESGKPRNVQLGQLVQLFFGDRPAEAPANVHSPA